MAFPFGLFWIHCSTAPIIIVFLTALKISFFDASMADNAGLYAALTLPSNELLTNLLNSART